MVSCSSCPISPTVLCLEFPLSQPEVTQGGLPLGISGSISQTPRMHPAQWSQCWWLANILFQQKPGSPLQDLLVFKSDSNKPQASGSPVTSVDPRLPQPVKGSCSSLGCRLRMRLIMIATVTKTLVFTRGFKAHSGPVPSLMQLSLLLCPGPCLTPVNLLWSLLSFREQQI